MTYRATLAVQAAFLRPETSGSKVDKVWAVRHCLGTGVRESLRLVNTNTLSDLKELCFMYNNFGQIEYYPNNEEINDLHWLGW